MKWRFASCYRNIIIYVLVLYEVVAKDVQFISEIYSKIPVLKLNTMQLATDSGNHCCIIATVMADLNDVQI